MRRHRLPLVLLPFALAAGCSGLSNVEGTYYLQPGDCAVVTAYGRDRTITLARPSSAAPDNTGVVILSGPQNHVNAYGNWEHARKETFAAGTTLVEPSPPTAGNYRVVVVNHGKSPATISIKVNNADGVEIIQAPHRNESESRGGRK